MGEFDFFSFNPPPLYTPRAPSLREQASLIGSILPPPMNFPSIPKIETSITPKTKFADTGLGKAASSGINAASSIIGNLIGNRVFGDSEVGGALGNLFSSGIGSGLSTIGNNLLKGLALTLGLLLNAGGALTGAGAGLAANYMGLGITSLMGNSKLGKAVGAGFASAAGTVGGTAANALVNGANVAKAVTNINPYALAGNVVGAALGAANGPSKEYGGTYGGITMGSDIAYDLATLGSLALPGGVFISAGMALNKGLSNLFGSTDGMTVQDAILGSAFMPAPVKWLNMAGASKTGTFNNLSWQNSEKAKSFMGDAFGNLLSKFDRARNEAGKTYGTFSKHAKRRALRNINYANSAWNSILAMADLNEIQNIRSLAMSSINNQKYALMLQGGLKLTAIGKQGMKIFNNATNHNIGMRLLSGAALIDNKQMILCNVPD